MTEAQIEIVISDEAYRAIESCAHHKLDAIGTKRQDGKWAIMVGTDTIMHLVSEQRPGEDLSQAIVRTAKAAKPKLRQIGMNDTLDLSKIKGTPQLHVIPKEVLRELLGRQDVEVLDDRDLRTIDAFNNVKRELLDNPAFTQEAKLRILSDVRRVIAAKKKHLSLLHGDKAALEHEMSMLQRRLTGAHEICQWLEQPPVLQRPDGSVFHKVQEAFSELSVVLPLVEAAMDRDLGKTLSTGHHVFVIEHDWAAAFKGAKDFDAGEVKMPFPTSVFEFQIRGKRVCLSTCEMSDGSISVIPTISTSVGWVLPWMYRWDNGAFSVATKRQDVDPKSDFLLKAVQPLMDMLADQIRAVLIALSAKVAQTDVVRAPHKLNHARERRGKLPIADYHVVSLARRARPARLPRADETELGTRKRLHFRRGHWRHYPDHKTYIEWMLVGDPDLGFIDKHYKL